MIFLDANVFLRYLIWPDDSHNRILHEAAVALLAAIEQGEEKGTTSEAVIAEVAFVLTSKRQYQLTVDEAAAFLTTVLQLPGLELPRGRKRLYRRAAEIWTEHPGLGFVDALTAATVELSGMRLATFDSDFDVFPGIACWAPPTEGSRG
jgi:predicted nucleic acid-binding protein